MRARRAVQFALLPFAIVACGGRIATAPTQDGGGVSSGDDGSSAGGSSGGGDGSTGLGCDAQVLPSCQASCCTPPGALESPQDVSAVYAAVVVRGQACSNVRGLIAAPQDVAGVEFGEGSTQPTPNGGTVGGQIYYLVWRSGVLVRGDGAAYQLPYEVGSEGPDGFLLVIHQAPGMGAGYFVASSSCPQSLQLVPDGPQDLPVDLVGAQ